MEPFTEPLEPSKSISINFSEKDLIEIYNHVPQILLNKIIKVSITENDPLFLKEERNGNYWVIKTELGIYWLFPKANFKINSHNINTVKYWFDCQGYQPDDSKEFTVSKLAQVSVVPNKQQWQLEVKGGLNFGNPSLSSQLKLELEQTKEEYKQLQSQLNQSTLECFDFQCQIQQLHQERELLLGKLEQAKKYQQEVLSHLVTREELQKTMQEAAEHFEVRTEYLFEDKIQNLLKVLNYEIFRIEKRINIDTILKELSELKNELENKIEKQLSLLVNADSLVNYSDSESWDDLSLPPKTVSTPDPAKPDQVSLNQLETSLISLEPTEQKIITYYNSNPKQFWQLYPEGLEVEITEKTFSNELLGSKEKIIFRPETRGTYWIVEDSECLYLLINKIPKINRYNLDYIREVFDCYKEKDNQDYHKFRLLKPAQVSKLNQEGEFFQLEQKGTLEFY